MSLGEVIVKIDNFDELGSMLNSTTGNEPIYICIYAKGSEKRSTLRHFCQITSDMTTSHATLSVCGVAKDW